MSNLKNFDDKIKENKAKPFDDINIDSFSSAVDELIKNKPIKKAEDILKKVQPQLNKLIKLGLNNNEILEFVQKNLSPNITMYAITKAVQDIKKRTTSKPKRIKPKE